MNEPGLLNAAKTFWMKLFAKLGTLARVEIVGATKLV
jgi:hypothetical protein